MCMCECVSLCTSSILMSLYVPCRKTSSSYHGEKEKEKKENITAAKKKKKREHHCSHEHSSTPPALQMYEVVYWLFANCAYLCVCVCVCVCARAHVHVCTVLVSPFRTSSKPIISSRPVSVSRRMLELGKQGSLCICKSLIQHTLIRYNTTHTDKI